MDNYLCQHLPVPYFQIDKMGKILRYSNRANHLFKPKNHFLEIVYVRDYKKVEEYLLQNHTATSTIDLKLKVGASFWGFYTCTITWEKDVGHLVCTEKNHRIVELEKMIQVQKRIIETKQSVIQSNNLLLESINKLLNRARI
ncbi:hypothetical protein IUK39_00315 [Priestia aryabhattai]|uniref:hypothetical protein n=1 Tax=Priestia aryabhattai TaxID=412384 RepID=UPI001C0CB4BD|nr:hypothetical protein [Priestia aryabhattai]MBU3568632.1 hypothetical protein [Priestia aryabhattai]